ncbi:hypothetical protein DFH08DRAFT_812959 [Mycena albidolilacea]|uniref:Uncharacterized protein n=1 Tax=Mycena albidolilacea TaxID=1033008 RepID=A0AAD7EMF2_9AGAR|nr:hypothetical protein DFH08DRAFT_812959 [Mycena albidolilacea]
MTDHSQFAPAALAVGASSSPVNEAPGPFVEGLSWPSRTLSTLPLDVLPTSPLPPLLRARPLWYRDSGLRSHITSRLVGGNISLLCAHLISVNIVGVDLADAVTDLLSPLDAASAATAAASRTETVSLPSSSLPETAGEAAPTGDTLAVATQSTAPTSATSTGATAIPTNFFHSAAPWLTDRLYTVVPPAPLGPSPTLNHTDKWFTITCRQYVGLTTNSAISLNAVTGVPGGLREKLATQAEALQPFNDVLAANAIAIL